MAYGTYSMYDNQVGRHNNVHFTPYQKPMPLSGRQMNNSEMFYPASSNYQQQQHISPQYNYQQSPQMAMGQMQPVQMQQSYADRQFGFNPAYNSMNVPKQNMVPIGSPVLNQLSNQQLSPQQLRQPQSGHALPQRQQQSQQQQQFYSQNYGKQNFSPMMNKPMGQSAHSKSSYVQFPKMPVAVQAQPVVPAAKFQSPTIGQVLGITNKKMKKFNTKDVGILHEFFNLNPTISELARRAERLVMEMEKKSKVSLKKNVVVRKEFQQSVHELSGGPIRLNTRHQQPGYVPYKESVVPATPSPSSSHSQFSPLCSDFNSLSPSNPLQSSFY
ncbi:unnamed protein product [Auanema sp. JU1783]|nr:unnamed protein product [Auanema sp. JU1783]